MSQGRQFEVRAPRVVKPIANGTYNGKIIDIKYRDQPYHYADLVISVDGLNETTVEASFPAKELTPTNGFGKFISNRFKLKVGDQVVPEQILLGKEVSFMVMNVPGKNDPAQFYPQVVKGTVFPKPGSIPAAQ